jgi:SAM-dependent methyltransferase
MPKPTQDLSVQTLPKFTDHDENRKNEPLDGTHHGRPEGVLLSLLDEATLRAESRPIKILDVGCGRGSLVAWLCANGWDAWGCDVVDNYLRAGRPWFETNGFGTDRLRMIDGSALPFEPRSFDVVVSDQVIEHVADLGAFVGGIATVSRAGTLGLHVFPASFRPVEPHLRAPIVHWLPKGRVRRSAIKAAIRVGRSVTHFSNLPLDQRAQVYSEFSDTETFYRLRRTVRRTFETHGIATDLRTPALAKVEERKPGLPAPAQRAAARLYSFAMQTYVRTDQRR